jgi:hypothetical protein
MKKIPNWIKRAIYMLVAIVASVLLLKTPALSFQGDKGIIYIRNYSMDQKMFYGTQTEIATGLEEVYATMSVKGLYYCSWMLVILTIACFLCSFWSKWRCNICVGAIICASVFYALLIFYALRITDQYNATVYPNWAALLPAIVIQLMILVRKGTIQSVMEDISPNEEESE